MTLRAKVAHWPQPDQHWASWGEVSVGWCCWKRRQKSGWWRWCCGRETLSFGRCSLHTTRDPEDLSTVGHIEDTTTSSCPLFLQKITSYRWSDPQSRLLKQPQETNVWSLCQHQDSRSQASCNPTQYTCIPARSSYTHSLSWSHLNTNEKTTQ